MDLLWVGCRWIKGPDYYSLPENTDSVESEATSPFNLILISKLGSIKKEENKVTTLIHPKKEKSLKMKESRTRQWCIKNKHYKAFFTSESREHFSKLEDKCSLQYHGPCLKYFCTAR